MGSTCTYESREPSIRFTWSATRYSEFFSVMDSRGIPFTGCWRWVRPGAPRRAPGRSVCWLVVPGRLDRAARVALVVADGDPLPFLAAAEAQVAEAVRADPDGGHPV